MTIEMMTVPVNKEYIYLFEQLQVNIEEALRYYAFERVQKKLLQAEKRTQRWEEKYGCSYDLFAYRTATDMAYVEQLETESDKMDWEGDLMMWEVDALELNKWRNHLQKLWKE
ncbi:hypothetical protein QUF64_14455 [Anaerolineales bacterium HSG6]|nr:hypothetical protein [Anaerolineales bacterium HSG6]